MPLYKLLHGKMHPPRKGPGAGGKVLRKGDTVEMLETRAARYSDMLERVVPAAPEAPEAKAPEAKAPAAPVAKTPKAKASGAEAPES